MKMSSKSAVISVGLALVASAALMLFVPNSFAQSTPVTKADVLKPVYTPQETANFKMLAKETIAAIDTGKNTEMVPKLTDLETAWDDNESTLKPKDPATWDLIDKTLDKAISALRSSRTDIPKGKAALEDLIKKLELATKS